MSDLLEYINTYIQYDLVTGKLTWKASPSNRVKVGQEATHVDKYTGYITIRLNGKLYQAHRIIWFLCYFEWPPLLEHIDGNRVNNSIHNLRVATHSQNNANNKRVTPNQYKGVTKQNNKWKAQCRGHIGMFDTIEEAAMAYDKRAIEVFGEFAVLNFKETSKLS